MDEIIIGDADERTQPARKGVKDVDDELSSKSWPTVTVGDVQKDGTAKKKRKGSARRRRRRKINKKAPKKERKREREREKRARPLMAFQTDAQKVAGGASKKHKVVSLSSSWSWSWS